MKQGQIHFFGVLEKAWFLNYSIRRRLRYLAMVNEGMLSYNSKHRKTTLPGPLGIQIQTIDGCNTRCLMCPYSTIKRSGTYNYMEDELYARILRDLKETGTVRHFTPMLQNEPLLDTKIAKRVREAKESFKDTALIHIVTNGALLTPKRANELIEANTDIVSVSIDAFREDTYKSIHKGLDFSKVLGNVYSLLERKPRPKVIARFLKQQANKGEEKMFVRHWKAKCADVLLHSVTNRAGTLESFDKMERPQTNQFKLFIRRALNRKFPFCPLPFFAMNVLWDGRVILCCNDWGPAIKIGDLKKQSLQKVWNSETMNHYRYLLYTGRSKESPICSSCSHKNGFWSTKKIN